MKPLQRVYPDIFIIGAPKCGTTTLFDWLSQHPHICPASIKEPHFFSCDLNHGPNLSMQEYLSLFTKTSPAQKHGLEGSVWYLFSTTAIPNILYEFPTARFIALFRDPVDMALSLHNQKLVSGHETVKSFSSAWHKRLPRREGKSVPLSCRESKLLDYEEACKIGSQLLRAKRTIQPGQLLTLSLNELKKAPLEAYLKVCSFLQLEPSTDIAFSVCNSASSRKVHSIAYLHALYKTFDLRYGMPKLGLGFLRRLDSWNRQGKRYDSMSAELRNQLACTFDEERRLLKSEYLDI